MQASGCIASSSTHPRPARRKGRRRLVCICLAGLVAASLAPGAAAAPPVDWTMGAGLVTMEPDWDLRPRQVVDATSVTAGGTSSAIASATTTTTVTQTASATSVAVSTSTAVPAGYQLPRAFDTTLGTNFTSTACPSFFETFLADPTFIECAPLSLLLTTSSDFFTAQRSPYSLLSFTLDASCSSNNATCSALMDSLARQIRRSNTCGPDLARQNPLVLEAVSGFENYQLMRQAGCQRSNTTNEYCLSEACAAPEPDELYFYFLPEGTFLPSGTQTECGSCPKQLLELYSTYASNTTLSISRTYSTARTLANQVCGPGFAPLAVTATSDASRLLATSFFLFIVLLAVAFF